MLASGYGSQSISDELTVSLYTTRAHTRNIYAKLDVHSRQELADRVRTYVGHARSDGGGVLGRPANISPHSLRMPACVDRPWL